MPSKAEQNTAALTKSLAVAREALVAIQAKACICVAAAAPCSSCVAGEALVDLHEIRRGDPLDQPNRSS